MRVSDLILRRREAPPDDRLREAIHSTAQRKHGETLSGAARFASGVGRHGVFAGDPND